VADIINGHMTDVGKHPRVGYDRDTREQLTVGKVGRWLDRCIGWRGRGCSEPGDRLATIDERVGVAHPKPVRGAGGSLLPEEAVFRRQSEVLSHGKQELRLGLSEGGHAPFILNTIPRRSSGR